MSTGERVKVSFCGEKLGLERDDSLGEEAYYLCRNKKTICKVNSTFRELFPAGISNLGHCISGIGGGIENALIR